MFKLALFKHRLPLGVWKIQNASFKSQLVCWSLYCIDSALAQKTALKAT